MAAEDSDGSQAAELIFSIRADGDRDPVVPSIGRYSTHEAIPLSRNLGDVGDGELHPLRRLGTIRRFTGRAHSEGKESQHCHRPSKRYVRLMLPDSLHRSIDSVVDLSSCSWLFLPAMVPESIGRGAYPV